MEPVVLFRKDGYNEEEYNVCKENLPVVTNRTLCHGQLVIGRYSVLPYYKELEQDLRYEGSRLINSYEQHKWIADFDYYQVLKNYTFESWTEDEFPYTNYQGPFVVKGATNSRKHQWNKRMFAENRREAIWTACQLCEDPFISQQKIIFRKYIPLKTFEIGLNGIRFTNEFRFFCLGNSLLEAGYYWTEALNVAHYPTKEVIDFAQKIADIVKNFCNFFVLDIAEKEEGGWILVEVNDAQMSGLSMCCAKLLYDNLAYEIKGKNYEDRLR